jgi:hypothetical protein
MLGFVFMFVLKEDVALSPESERVRSETSTKSQTLKAFATGQSGEGRSGKNPLRSTKHNSFLFLNQSLGCLG